MSRTAVVQEPRVIRSGIDRHQQLAGPSPETARAIFDYRHEDWPFLRDDRARAGLGICTREVVDIAFQDGYQSVISERVIDEAHISDVVGGVAERNHLDRVTSPMELNMALEHLGVTYEYGYDAGQLAHPGYKGGKE